jgi:squalene-hopene/tetraprenyl-beta-curcumene cyclase
VKNRSSEHYMLRVLAVVSAVALLVCGRATKLEAAASQSMQLQPPGNLSLRNEVRHAIDKGIKWLQENQQPEGFWSTPDHPALTALALVAISGAQGPDTRSESPALEKGYEYLLGCVRPDGAIYGKPELVNYNTAVSILALLAANRAEYHPLILNARRYLIGLQSIWGEEGKTDDVFEGGIGYGSTYKHSDMSNTMQALEALYYSRHLVKDTTLAAPDLNWEAAIRFIQNCQNLPAYNKQSWASDDPQNKGGFVYFPGYSMAGETNLPSGRVALRSYGSISYAGLLSYIYADLRHDDPRVVAVFEWLKNNFTLEENPGMGSQGLFFYYHTMAKALNTYGVDSLRTDSGGAINWREGLALKLLDLQQPDGSWVNTSGRWWEKDPVLVTSYALISLGIIERKL